MRRRKQLFCVLSLSAFLVVGCLSETTSDPVPPSDETEQVETDQDIMEEFRALAKDAPAPDLLIQLIDENVAKVAIEHADEMVETLRSLLETTRLQYEDRIFELDPDNELLMIDGSEVMFKESSISEIQNEELKAEVEYLYANFYQLVNLEGRFYPVVDYSELKKYNGYLSDEFQAYIEINSMEFEQRSMADGGLIISFEELANRIYQMEDYLRMATHEDRKDDILTKYDYHISAYLKGLPNTPITEDATSEIREEVLVSYRETAIKEYEISSATKQHLEMIEDNNYVIDENILGQADVLIEQVLKTFKTD